MDAGYDGFVKDIDTPKEAIKEVKLRVKMKTKGRYNRGQEIEKFLLETYGSVCNEIRCYMEDTFRELSGGQCGLDEQEHEGVEFRVYHKIPTDLKKKI
ncbi:MAG: hypothetical protein QMD71_00130 [bacterium]|nr:hypothetical protein [bacterium]